MKKIFYIFIFVLTVQNFYSQEITSVEKSIFGIQTGPIGIWAHNEFKLSSFVSLRSEIGIQMGFSTDKDDKTITAIFPRISMEPRWYYNLSKRSNNGKNIYKNSGNYFSIFSIYNSNKTIYSSNDNVEYVSSFAIAPKWGIKRTYNKHLTFETGFCLGPQFYTQDFIGKKSDVYVDLSLRIGYTF